MEIKEFENFVRKTWHITSIVKQNEYGFMFEKLNGNYEVENGPPGTEFTALHLKNGNIHGKMICIIYKPYKSCKGFFINNRLYGEVEWNNKWKW